MPNYAFYRDASNRLAFDVSNIGSEEYRRKCHEIAQKFDLVPLRGLVVGLDEMFRDYHRDNLVVGLEWDIWSGFIVVAKTSQAEALVEEIADFLEIEPVLLVYYLNLLSDDEEEV